MKSGVSGFIAKNALRTGRGQKKICDTNPVDGGGHKGKNSKFQKSLLNFLKYNKVSKLDYNFFLRNV